MPGLKLNHVSKRGHRHISVTPVFSTPFVSALTPNCHPAISSSVPQRISWQWMASSWWNLKRISLIESAAVHMWQHIRTLSVWESTNRDSTFISVLRPISGNFPSFPHSLQPGPHITPWQPPVVAPYGRTHHSCHKSYHAHPPTNENRTI